MSADPIKTEIFKKYKKEDQKGLFFSLLDEQKNLLASNGVISTDKPLDQLIDVLYNGIVAKYPTAKTIVAEIIQDMAPQNDVAKLLMVSPAENGIFMITKDKQKSGVMLPGTAGVTDMKSALTMIKQKFSLSGDVEISTFTTDRFIISL